MEQVEWCENHGGAYKVRSAWHQRIHLHEFHPVRRDYV